MVPSWPVLCRWYDNQLMFCCWYEACFSYNYRCQPWQSDLGYEGWLLVDHIQFCCSGVWGAGFPILLYWLCGCLVLRWQHPSMAPGPDFFFFLKISFISCKLGQMCPFVYWCGLRGRATLHHCQQHKWLHSCAQLQSWTVYYQAVRTLALLSKLPSHATGSTASVSMVALLLFYQVSCVVSSSVPRH